MPTWLTRNSGTKQPNAPSMAQRPFMISAWRRNAKRSGLVHSPALEGGVKNGVAGGAVSTTATAAVTGGSDCWNLLSRGAMHPDKHCKGTLS